MIRTKLFLACALAFVVSLAGASASAQEPTNQITYFTFSAPFELPGGKTLPAGKYVFKILDSPSNRHVVQIMSEDQMTMHATLHAIPAQRMEPSNEPEVRFMEAEANMAPAIRTWWYPGRSIGHEFIYPKDHARRLASRQSEGVLTVSGDASSDEAMNTAELTRLGKDGRETAWNSTETAANAQAAANAQHSEHQTTAQTSQPAQTTGATSGSATTTSSTAVNTTTQSTAGESTTPTQTTTATGQTAQSSTQPMTSGSAQTSGSTTASAETTSRTAASAQTTARTTAADTTAADTSARTELPRTASPLPLFALLGLGSLLGAGALRFGR